MQRFGDGLKTKVRSLISRPSGLDEIAVDDLATTTKLQSWEAVQIPERLRFSSRLAINLVVSLYPRHRVCAVDPNHYGDRSVVGVFPL